MGLTSLAIMLVIVFMSMGVVANAASDFPDSFLVIGNKAISLDYASSNRDVLKNIVNEYFAGGGKISGLCAVVDGSYVWAESAELLDKNEILHLMSGVNTLIDKDNPSGTEVVLPPELQAAKANVTAEFSNNVFHVTVHSVSDLDNVKGFYLEDDTNGIVSIGEKESIAVALDELLTVSIVNESNEVIGTFELHHREYNNESVVVATDGDNNQEIEYLEVITIE